MIGNITKDKTPDGAILGGTGSYSAVAARRLGLQVTMVSAVGDDAPPLDVLDGIPLHRIAHPTTLTFQNVYEQGTRRQKWLVDGGRIALADVPTAWRRATVVHLAPIAQEMSPALCAEFPHSLVGVTAQGWLRGRNARRDVIFQPHPALEKYLPYVDVLVVSLSDFFGDRDAMLAVLTAVPIGVETLGAEGCTVYRDGETMHVPVEPQPEIDPTGAGDIFATAFFAEYARTQDRRRAAQFANACASLSVTRQGAASAPTRAEVEQHCRRMYG